MAAAFILKKSSKSRYLDNSSTDRYEIWHGDAIRHLWCVPQLELCNLKNPTWRRPPSWKIESSSYLNHNFSDFNEIWHGDAVRPSWPIGDWSVTNLRSKEIEDGGGRHLNNIKITISRQRFDRSAQHLAYNDVYWSSKPGELFTKVVRQFLCVNFAYANS